jgi:hypothetical protein
VVIPIAEVPEVVPHMVDLIVEVAQDLVPRILEVVGLLILVEAAPEAEVQVRLQEVRVHLQEEVQAEEGNFIMITLFY